MPQEIYDDLFYEQAVVDLTEIKRFLKCLQTPYFSLFLMTMIIWKKKKKLSSSFSRNLASIQNTDYPLYPRWKHSTHTDSYRDAVDGVKKITHSSSKHQQTRHRSGDLCISNTIRVGVGKRYFALAHWCIGWREFMCESREDFTQFF